MSECAGTSAGVGNSNSKNCKHYHASIASFRAHVHILMQPAGAPNVTRRNLTVPFTLTSFALSLLLVFRYTSFMTHVHMCTISLRFGFVQCTASVLKPCYQLAQTLAEPSSAYVQHAAIASGHTAATPQLVWSQHFCRTNSAYGRWWEARTLLGGLLAITRTLARQVAA